MTTSGVGDVVVILEPSVFFAPPTIIIHERALISVTLANQASDWGRIPQGACRPEG